MTMARRSLIHGVGAAALMAMAEPIAAEAQLATSPSTGRDAAGLAWPANACDCHMHIYDSRFPSASYAKLHPANASIEDYRRLQTQLGLTRNVIVTPSTYGTDNSCMLEAISRTGATARGVAVVDTSVSDTELKRLRDAGVRGIRFNMAPAGATTIDMIEPLSKRVNDLGWHVQIQMEANQILEVEPLLRRVVSPIVFDHLGRLPEPAGPAHPAFSVIARLMDRGRAWVKLSGSYIESKIGPPSYSDSGRVVAAYVRTAPERLVWGSNWPHPSAKDKPDDVLLFARFNEWIPDGVLRRRILVDNAAALYDFP